MIRQAFIDRQPIGRLGTAEEMAWLAVYLASDEFELHDRPGVHSPTGDFSL